MIETESVMVIAVETWRIAYMALPKAACTAVKAALGSVDPTIRPPEGVTENPELWHAVYPTRRFRPHRWEAYGDFWRFAVVRDPFQRLLSAYLDRVVKRKELFNSLRLRRPEFADLPREPDPDTFLQNLDRYRAAASVVKHHTITASVFLGPPPIERHFDAIYPVERLDALAEELSSRTGRPVTIGRHNPSGGAIGLDDLSPRTIDAIRPFLDREYAYLAAYYPNPLA